MILFGGREKAARVVVRCLFPRRWRGPVVAPVVAPISELFVGYLEEGGDRSREFQIALSFGGVGC